MEPKPSVPVQLIFFVGQGNFRRHSKADVRPELRRLIHIHLGVESCAERVEPWLLVLKQGSWIDQNKSWTI